MKLTVRRARGLAWLLALATAAGTVTVAVPAAGSARAAALGKGPVGWDTYRRLDRLPELRAGVRTLQSSSYDRKGGNDDGFAGTYSCLRTDPDGCVLAEHAGAGEVDSIWFTRDHGDVTKTGRIRIDLDGHRVVDAPLQDVVNGKLGAPFAWPLVGGGDDTVGGAVVKVPMPFQRSMKVSVEHNPLFHHVTYRAFENADGVRTFDPKDRAEDVLAALRAFGLRDPKPAVAGERATRTEVAAAPGASARLARLTGSGRITALRLRLPGLARSPRVVDDGRAFGTGGSSSFQVAIDPANTGVRLTRRYDPHVGHQRARLLVDGRPVGDWDSGAPGAAGVWADQTLQVPAELVRGKSRITVVNEFLASDVDVNEFHYTVASQLPGGWRRTDVMDLGPNHPGEEAAHGYRIDRQSWQGERNHRYPVSEADRARSDQVLDQARVKITFDGRGTVYSPVGEFFGSGLGRYDTRSQLFAVDATSDDGEYTAWWPMPYGSEAVVELVNGSDHPITGASAEVVSVADPSVATGLAEGRLGHFRATTRRGQSPRGVDDVFLDVKGQGVFYGVTHSMRGLTSTGNRRNYLEGDERVFVDGESTPSMHGTGTEDFYESGWYFRDGNGKGSTTYVMPLAGHPSWELDGDGCRYDCTGAFRLMTTDAIAFGSALRFTIEHGPVNDEPVDASSTAYWYGR